MRYNASIYIELQSIIIHTTITNYWVTGKTCYIHTIFKSIVFGKIVVMIIVYSTVKHYERVSSIQEYSFWKDNSNAIDYCTVKHCNFAILNTLQISENFEIRGCHMVSIFQSMCN